MVKPIKRELKRPHSKPTLTVYGTVRVSPPRVPTPPISIRQVVPLVLALLLFLLPKVQRLCVLRQR